MTELLSALLLFEQRMGALFEFVVVSGKRRQKFVDRVQKIQTHIMANH
jgi:hypothetical protein